MMWMYLEHNSIYGSVHWAKFYDESHGAISHLLEDWRIALDFDKTWNENHGDGHKKRRPTLKEFVNKNTIAKLEDNEQADSLENEEVRELCINHPSYQEIRDFYEAR